MADGREAVRWWNKVFLKNLLLIFITFLFVFADPDEDCTKLRIGQYKCQELDIDIETQQPRFCTKDNKAKVTCSPAPNVTCKNLNVNRTFEKEVPCKYTNGYSFETALLLSIFLGMFGLDRFYLGYPAIGLVKFCTLGFMFLGQLIDIILIAIQVVGPADGSNYIINYYGAGLSQIKVNNMTYVKPQDDLYV